jgi:hypothetical protein
MELQEAWERLAQCGRMMGSGPATVIFDAFTDIQTDLEAMGVNPKSIGMIAVGYVVGQIQAEDRDTLAKLDDIEARWLAGEFR